MLRATLASALLLVAAAIAGCSRSDAAVASRPASPTASAQTAAPAQTAAQAQPMAAAPTRPPVAGRPRLVFFMNPNGRPCQMQDQILQGMGAELTARADLVYYRTTDGNDLLRFEQYGIRSLPTLVLTDSNGNELRRATPGIQSDAQVRQLLGP